MRSKSFRFYVKPLILFLPLFGTVLLFQNCGPSFKTVDSFSSNLNSIDQASNSPLALPVLNVQNTIPSLGNAKNISASFSLQTDPRATVDKITCQLDANPIADCSSGSWSATGLNDGDHTLVIKALDSKAQSVEKILQFRIDATSPQLLLSEGPSGVIGSNSTKIVFAASDNLSGIASRTCALDANAMAACPETVTITGLAEGAHRFNIQATDLAGNQSAVLTLNWTVNTTAPSVTISTKPNPFSNSSSASFTFTGSAAGMALAKYECATDGGAFAPCTSPFSLTGLAEGTHSFSIRGTSAAGILSSPVLASWVVDTTLPSNPVLTTTTSAFSKLNTASISFASNDAGSMIKEYQCSVDGGAFAVCTSPRSLTALTQGAHSFAVRALDNAGNQSAQASFAWTVDSTLPVITVGSQPAASSTNSSASISFTVSDSGGSGLLSTECSLDAGAFAACTSPINLTNVTVGAHSFVIRATDRAQNQASATVSWTVMNLILDGKILYANNCAGCHAPLDVSTKLNKSASLIQNAITNNAGNVMASPNLIALTPAQVQAIADVLIKAPAFSPVACAAPTNRGLDRPSIQRLTKTEIINTLTDLFDAPLMSQVVTELQQIPDEKLMFDVTAFDPLHTGVSVEGHEGLAYRIGEIVSASTAYKTSIGTSCLAASTVTQACFSAFIDNFGKKALRRPLTAAEKTSYLNMTTARPNADGVHVIVSRLLASPEMIFHIETGKAVVGSRVQLTDYEIASRISYGVIGSKPDDVLMAAADNGSLSNLTTVDAQVRRLMDTPKAQQKLKPLFSEWLRLNDQVQPPDSVTSWAGLSPTGLAKEINDEVFDFIFEIVWKNKGSFSDLMTKTIAIPKSARMANIYGASTFTGAAVSAPDHPGLIFRAGVMASPKKDTSPILRGVFVKRQVLCEPMGTPPPNAFQIADSIVLDPLVYANHEVTAAKTSAVACQACHQSINATGFLLEVYDPLGRARKMESVLSSTGQVLKTHALPGSSNLTFDGVTKTYSTPADLAQMLATSPRAYNCMSTYTFRHLTRRKEATNDNCSIQDMTNSLGTSQSVFDSLVKAIANEDVFWRGL